MKRIYLILPIITVVSLFLTVVSLADTGVVNIAPQAVLDAPECNPRDKASAIVDGFVPAASFGDTGNKYSSHAFVSGFTDVDEYNAVCDNYETLTFTWETEVTVDSLGIFFACSAPEREPWLRFGGEDAPASYTVLYLANGEYEPVTSPAGFGTDRDKLNVTSFDKVTTTSIRIVMTKLTDDELDAYVYKKAFESGGNLSEGLILSTLGIGIYEIEIYTAHEETTVTVDDTTAPEETTDEHEDTTAPEETTDEHEDTTVPEETTDKPEDTTVPEETADKPEDTTVPEETTDKPEDTTVPEETTDKPEDTTAPEETTDKPEDTIVPEETTDKPEDTTAPEETTDKPEDTTVPEEAISEAEDTTTQSVTTADSKAVTSAFINAGSAFGTDGSPPSPAKIITVSAATVTAAIAITCGAVILIKKKR